MTEDQAGSLPADLSGPIQSDVPQPGEAARTRPGVLGSQLTRLARSVVDQAIHQQTAHAASVATLQSSFDAARRAAGLADIQASARFVALTTGAAGLHANLGFAPASVVADEQMRVVGHTAADFARISAQTTASRLNEVLFTPRQQFAQLLSEPGIPAALYLEEILGGQAARAALAPTNIPSYTSQAERGATLADFQERTSLTEMAATAVADFQVSTGVPQMAEFARSTDILAQANTNFLQSRESLIGQASDVANVRLQAYEWQLGGLAKSAIDEVLGGQSARIAAAIGGAGLSQLTAELERAHVNAVRLPFSEPHIMEAIRQSQSFAPVSDRVLGQLTRSAVSDALVNERTHAIDALTRLRPAFAVADMYMPRWHSTDLIASQELFHPRTPKLVRPRQSELAVAGDDISSIILSPLDLSRLWAIKAFLSRDDIIWLVPDVAGDPLAVLVLACGVGFALSGNPSLMILSTLLLGYAGNDLYVRIDRHRRGED